MNAAEPIDGSTATPAELRRAGVDALVKASGTDGSVGLEKTYCKPAAAATRPTRLRIWHCNGLNSVDVVGSRPFRRGVAEPHRRPVKGTRRIQGTGRIH